MNTLLRYKKITSLFSGIVLLAAVGSLLVYQLNLGIEFTGGSILEVEYEESRPTPAEVRTMLEDFGFGSMVVQPIEERGLLLRLPEVSPEVHQQILERLGEGVVEQNFESIGPVIGEELRGKTLIIMGVGGIVILAYVAIAFRQVVAPLRSWHFSVASIAALLHDLLIPLGVPAILGAFWEVSVTIPIVVALLTVLGYSINDTVVVFDRVRENLQTRKAVDVEDAVNRSLRQTLPRNLSTSFTTLVVLFAILLFGGETLTFFALTLIVGVLAGTYSSLFLAPAILVFLSRRSRIAD